MDIKEKVARFINRQHLLAPTQRIVVAVSGGADSVVLLNILQQLGYQCIIAHCNFHLRGADADADADFVAQLARKYQIPFHRNDFDTNTIAAERKISVEMAARDLRYAWFEQLRLAEKCDAIAVAHHANDNAETVLLNMARGTGINGLCGIQAKNRHIVRPLLDCTRAEIIAYAHAHHLAYRTDATNAETIYRRNFVRHNIVPLFEQLNPAFIETIARNIEHTNDIRLIFNTFVQQTHDKICYDTPSGLHIDTEKLLQLPAPQTLLYEFIHPYGFNSDTVATLFNGIGGLSGISCLTEKYQAVVTRGKIIITPRSATDSNIYQITDSDTEIFQPLYLKIERLDTMPDTLKTDTHTAYFDADKIQFPLTLRHWQQGDTFVPFGMHGHKKVSDLFVDKKLNLIEKSKVWIMTSNDLIIWILGIRTDHRFRVTNRTRHLLRITFSA
ncbi:MAG: tRNA lysidine(34) synthetase TilS [Paludibacteraceae bacterium]